MKWFDRWFQRQSKKAWEAARENCDSSPGAAMKSISISRDLDSRESANIRVHDAVGGRVIEISSYDNLKDRTNRELYIIHEDAELGPELTSIIMQHSLRH